MNKLKVLMVGVGPDRVGGMWTVAEQYINSEKYNGSVDLTYVPTSRNGSIFSRVLYMIRGLARIRHLLYTESYDIVHIHMAEKGSTLRKGIVAGWSRKRGIRTVIHLHAGPFMRFYDSVPAVFQKRIRKIFGYADAVLTLGEYWKKELARIVPEDRLFVLFNGVDVPEENPYSLSSTDIVYMGVLRKEKGTYDLIDAVEKIDPKLPPVTKVILCGNDLEGDMQQTIDKKGLNERFELPGWVSGEDKDRICGNAMINVLPSYFEGLSMTVLEAMAQGTPVVTTDISTMPEVVPYRELLVTPGDVNALADVILRLSEDPELRSRLSREGFERVREKFSLDAMMDTTIGIYHELLK